MYSASTDVNTQPDPSLIQLSFVHKMSWKDLSRSYSNLITGLLVELKQTRANYVRPFSLCLLSKTFTVAWYLKPLISSNKSLNKSSVLDLLVSNWAKGSFESIILIFFLELRTYLLNASGIFATLSSS